MPIINGKFYPDTQMGAKAFRDDMFGPEADRTKSSQQRTNSVKKVVKKSKRI